MDESNKSVSVKRRLSHVFCPINVEPLIFLYSVSIGIMLNVNPAFIYWKKCTEIFSDRPDVSDFCHSIKSQNSSVQNIVQKPASVFNLYQAVCYCLPSMLISMYSGAWSEVNGRKPPLMIAIAGFVLAEGFVITVASVSAVPLWVIFPATLINGFTGGGIVVMMAGLSMVTDLSTGPTAITVRIAVTSFCLTAGMVVGSSAVGEIMDHLNSYSFAFLACTLMASLAFLYGVFFVNETVDVTNRQADINETTDNLCSRTLEKLKDTGKVLIRPRRERRRAYLIIGLVLFVVVFAGDVGMPGLLLLFVKHEPLDWSDKRFDYMIAITMASASLGFLFLTPVFKFLRIRDSGIVIFGVTFLLARQILLSLSKQYWMVYTYAGCAFLSAVLYPGFRSFLSKQVERDEIGRVFAAVATAENLAPVLSGFIYSSVYSKTVDFFPGFVFALAAFLNVLCVLLVGWIHIDSYCRSRSVSEDQDPIVNAAEDVIPT